MVRIDPPPPKRTTDPVLHLLPPAATLQRIYRPDRYGTTACGFRFEGPFSRFDHHEPGQRRGIHYSAFSLSGCVVEVIGDTGVVDGIAKPDLSASFVSGSSREVNYFVAPVTSGSTGFTVNGDATLSWTGTAPSQSNLAFQVKAGWNDPDAVIPPTEVPGPLPLLGVITAFGYSRKLRRRIHR